MVDQSEKPIAQIAYETFLEQIAKTDEGAAEAKHAPPWTELPEHVRIVIAEAVGAAVRSFAPALICEVAPEEMSFAQVGYQAYIARTGGLNYQGLPCPTFEALTETIKAAWAAAAIAIRSEHEHRSANDYELAVSKEELAELVAGLDAAQRSEAHNPEVCFPLRTRLRAVLLAPEAEADEEPEPKAHAELPSPATESTSAEPELSAASVEASALAEAPAGLPVAPELPSPSKAPPAPELTAEEAIPGPPSAQPTDTSAPADGEPESIPTETT